VTILVDSNIPMYLVGAPHPHKIDAHRLVQRCIAQGDRLVTDVEVLQEILHRYVAIQRRDMIQPAFDAVLGLVDEVLALDAADLEVAKGIALGAKRLSARDAVHVALMRRHSIRTIMSFDADFDVVPGVDRLSR
jgi:predicted nucleic acid-binding protein